MSKVVMYFNLIHIPLKYGDEMEALLTAPGIMRDMMPRLMLSMALHAIMIVVHK